MSILNSTFWRLPRGHWAWAGIQQQFHTWQYPKVGCPVCEAEGWIPDTQPAPPHYTAQHIPESVGINGEMHSGYYHMELCQQPPDAPAPDPDSTPAYLAMAGEEVTCAIRHLELACADSRVDASVRRKALGALRDALTAIEAEMEARNGDAR